MTPGADLDLPSIVARTSRSYDALPYTSDPFPETHPARLAAIARLFALDAAPPAAARILELGCAAGGNIIPLAARYPKAACVGIDLSRAQAAAAQRRIAQLGLANIDVRSQDFAEFIAEPRDGAFDYIICHGVYTWVPAPLRDTILRICRERLSPRGIALISYNVLPGWRMLQGLRDSFLLHCTPDADPQQRVAEARGLLEFLAKACPQPGPYRDFLVAQAEALRKSSDDYIAHEFLDDVNEPCSFSEFIAAAGRHGLAFLAETELPSMILANYAPGIEAPLRGIGVHQLLATEQYIDMLSGRTFRHTLLVGAERVSSIDRALDPLRVDGMHFIGGGDLALTGEHGGATLAAPTGRRMHTGSPALAAALAGFVAAYPASASVDDLVAALPEAARNGDARALVREALLNAVLNGLATPRSDAVLAAARPGSLPAAWPVARADAASGAAATTNLRHERVTIGGLAQFVLPLLDGSRDRAALRRALVDGARDGRLAFDRDGTAVHDPVEQERIASDQLDALLPALGRAALLVS